MSIEEFQDLVKKLADRSTRFPRRYKFQTLLLSTLGYLFIWGILALLVSVLVLTIVYGGKYYHLAVQITIAFTIAGYYIVGAIWVRFPPPQGIPLDKEIHSELWRVVNELAIKVHGPQVDKILLTDEVNLSIDQHPKFGILGWTENYLIIGVPLMLAITPEQFTAVVAHEMGHLSATHGKTSGWIFRVRLTWHRLLEELNQQSNWTIIIFQSFFEWYVPYFDAFTLVLRRSNEYEADKIAVEAVGVAQYGSTLINGRLRARWLNDEFWPVIYEQVAIEPTPPNDVYRQLANALKTPLTNEQAKIWLQAELEFVTQVGDSHPALSDRLKAINYVAVIPEHSCVSAAEHYFDERLPDILSSLSEKWLNEQEDFWLNRYEDVQEAKAYNAYLKSKLASGQELSVEEAWDIGNLFVREENISEALPFYEQVLDSLPDYAEVWLRIGRIKLDNGEEQGIEYIEKAMKLDAESIIPGCSLVYHFLMEQSREEEAEQYSQRARARAAWVQAVQEDRDYSCPEDPWFPHGLADDEVQMILRQLEIYPEITKVYLARRKHKGGQDTLLLLGLKIETFEEDPWEKRWQRAVGKSTVIEIDRDIIQRVADRVICPEEFVVFPINFWTRKILKKFKAVPQSRVK